MALLQDLIQQIDDPVLRERIMQETEKLVKQKKFGLVFEEHLPECTPLFDMPIKRGCNVMLRDNKEDKSIYVVMKIEEDKAICTKRENQGEIFTFSIPDIVRVAEFGEPIYPYLKPLDSANLSYILKSMPAQSWASVPPAPGWNSKMASQLSYFPE